MHKFLQVLLFSLLTLLFVKSSSLDDWNDSDDGFTEEFFKRSKRIIGGEGTGSDEEQPFLVSIRGKSSGWFWKKSYRYCGGSVISDHWILTAAHCFDDMRDPDAWRVRLASRKIKGGIVDNIGHLFGKITGNKKWQEFKRDVVKIVVHPDYNPSAMWVNDIAMMKMEKAVPSGKDFAQIRAIRLPRENTIVWPKDSQECLMMGWGCSQAGGRVQKRTMKVVLPKVTDHECKRTWGISATKRLCAGENFRSKGICPGDSGGPLVCKAEDSNEWMQAGIASFTSKDTPGQRPGAFTRVSKYVSWVKKTMKS